MLLAAMLLFLIGMMPESAQAGQGRVHDLVAVIRKDGGQPSDPDTVRRFIWSNSRHKIDNEFYAHWHRQDVIIDKMIAFHGGRQEMAPPMECTSRRDLMKSVLQAQGIRVRTINVYAQEDGFPAHSFLEVWDVFAQKWFVQDPDYNLYWMLADRSRRAGIEDMIKGGPDAVVPCPGPDSCGWDELRYDGRSLSNLYRFFGMAVVRNSAGGESVLNVPKLFDMRSPVLYNGRPTTFCQLHSRLCG